MDNLVKWWGTALAVILIASMGAGLVLAQDNDIGRVTLPRTFLEGRLGMAMEELVHRDSHIARTMRSSKIKQSGSIRLMPQDPYIHHVEYRFFRGKLYEQSVFYRRDRVPRGYEGLGTRLREVYGKPIAEDFVDFDSSPDVLSAQKTVWKDDATRIVLADVRRMPEGKEYNELVLTMTDLALERSREQAEQERLHQKELRVPIPLPDRQRNLERAAGSAVERAQSETNG